MTHHHIRLLILQKLILSLVGLKYVDLGGFCGLKNVSVLLMTRNHLSSPPPLCPLKCSLETLDLYSNNIAQFDKNFLMGFSKLQSIHLGRNQMFQPPDLHWVHNTLRLFWASGNVIESLDAFHTDAPFKNLGFIEVGSNNIRTFNVTLLRHLPRLKYLYLYSNRLRYVDDFRSYYKGFINLRGNPWHCDGALSWMGKEDMAFEEGLACASPSCAHGMAITEMGK